MKKKRKSERLLSIQEAASALHAYGFSITASGVREEMKAGRLRVYTMQGREYIAQEDLDAYIEASQ